MKLFQKKWKSWLRRKVSFLIFSVCTVQISSYLDLCECFFDFLFSCICHLIGINSFKFFLAYKGALMINDELLLEGFKKCKSLGALAMVHAENGDAVYEGQKRMIELGIFGPEGHTLSRPSLVTFRIMYICMYVCTYVCIWLFLQTIPFSISIIVWPSANLVVQWWWTMITVWMALSFIKSIHSGNRNDSVMCARAL